MSNAGTPQVPSQTFETENRTELPSEGKDSPQKPTQPKGPEETPAIPEMKPATGKKISYALENWEIWIYDEWLGAVPSRQDKHAELFYNILKKFDPNATIQRRPAKGQGILYTFNISLYGDGEQIMDAIETIQSMLLKIADNYNIHAGSAYANIQYNNGASDFVQGSVGPNTDFLDSFSSLLDSVYNRKNVTKVPPQTGLEPASETVQTQEKTEEIRGTNDWMPEHIAVNSIPQNYNYPIRNANPFENSPDDIKTSENDYADTKRQTLPTFEY
jgi:hypothetical protein